MILDISVYLAVFAATVCLVSLFQKTYNHIKIRYASSDGKNFDVVTYCIVGCLFIFPIIAMFGLRYGIGTDYFNYEQIYNAVHKASIGEYWNLHNRDVRYFYIEPGYYALNKIFPSYRLLLWVVRYIRNYLHMYISFFQYFSALCVASRYRKSTYELYCSQFGRGCYNNSS